MFTYKIIFFLHILFRRIFKIDLRPFLIRFFYSFSLMNNKTLNEVQKISSYKLFIDKLYKAHKSYCLNKDKRALWELHRLDFLNNTRLPFKTRLDDLLIWISNIKESELIIFENMMECSLRASNILIFYQNNKDKFSKDEISLIRKFLKKTYFLNYLAPDMYFKRKGLILRDESNNHFMFCLFFQILYLNNLSNNIDKRLNFLLQYIECKFSVDGYLMEGSSFYSHSIANATLKILFLINHNLNVKIFLNLFKALCSSVDDNLDLQNLNFGDKDGTIFLPSVDLDLEYKRYSENLTNGHKFDLKDNIALIIQDDIKLIVNHRKVYDYGSLGHYHDDFGHFNLYDGKQALIVDPGTLSYSDPSMRFDKSHFHNAPSPENSESMIHLNNFEKKFVSKNNTLHTNDILTLSQKISSGAWTREFSLNSVNIKDEFKFIRNSSMNIFLTSLPIINKYNTTAISLKFENLIIKISCNELFNYNIEPTVIAKTYSEPSRAYLLVMNFKKSIDYKLKWDIKCLN